MSSDERRPLELRIARVAIAFDASCEPGLLAAAADLAARLEAQLEALFVEDDALLRLAALPFAQEICLASAVARPFTPDALRRGLQTAADRLRAAVAETAGRARVTWTFRIERGALRNVTIERTTEADVVLLAPPTSTGRSSVKKLSSAPPAPAPVPAGAPSSARSRTPDGIVDGRSIAVLYDDSPAARRALAMALQAARGGRTPVLVLATGPDATDEAARRCIRQAATLDAPVCQLARLPADDANALFAVLAAHPCSLLLVPAGSPLFASFGPADRSTGLPCPVGVVR